MRNDVSIPPEDSSVDETSVIREAPTREVSSAPVPPPEGLKADVTLFDHPNFEPGGAGNFWLLGIIGLFLIVVAVVVIWMLHGLMK